MQIYDVSVPLSATTPTYPGDPGIEIKPWLKLADGDVANVSLINFGLHSGTHVDAPAHFIADGSRVESLPLENLIGEAEVVEVANDVRAIDESFVNRPDVIRYFNNFRFANKVFERQRFDSASVGDEMRRGINVS